MEPASFENSLILSGEIASNVFTKTYDGRTGFFFFLRQKHAEDELSIPVIYTMENDRLHLPFMIKNTIKKARVRATGSLKNGTLNELRVDFPQIYLDATYLDIFKDSPKSESSEQPIKCSKCGIDLADEYDDNGLSGECPVCGKYLCRACADWESVHNETICHDCRIHGDDYDENEEEEESE